jgi:hypothetical protein
MAELSDYLEDRIVNFMRNVAVTGHAAAYVALYTAAPSDAGGGTEVSGGSYARQLAGLSAPSPAGVSANAADITFPTATANWGTVTHVGLFDAVTAGNLLMWSPLDVNKTVNDGDTFKINAGDLDVTIS